MGLNDLIELRNFLKSEGVMMSNNNPFECVIDARNYEIGTKLHLSCISILLSWIDGHLLPRVIKLIPHDESCDENKYEHLGYRHFYGDGICKEFDSVDSVLKELKELGILNDGRNIKGGSKELGPVK